MLGLSFREVLLIVAVSAFFGTILGLLAWRKHRNPFAWGIVGGLPYLWIPTAIVLGFMPFLCPKCKGVLSNEAWKERRCSRCGSLRRIGFPETTDGLPK